MLITCSCPQTCESIADGSACSTSDCKPNCQCPSGTVLENDLCLGPSSCPCYHGGKVFKFGEHYEKDVCISCMCLQDGFSCQKKCNKSCSPHEELVTHPDQCCYCKEKCRSGMIYKQCSCPVTCQNTSCDSTTCQPGCECPPEQYDDGAKCVPPSDCYCIVDGRRVESGESWHKGNCLTCSCKDGSEQCNKTCNITNCPQGYELVTPYGGCCTCIMRVTTSPMTTVITTTLLPGCIVNNTLKNVGETWSNDLCENCTCEYANQIKCVATSCPSTCPQGCKIKQTPGKCCNECVPQSYTPTPIVCVDNGITYQVGESWKPDSCQNCSCSSEGRVKCRIEQCLKNCPVGYESRVIADQCCPECVPINKCRATNTSSVVTDINGCVSSNAKISFCSGPCNSNATVSVFGNLTIISDCQCCKPTVLAKESTQMVCPDGSTYIHYYPVIQACSCTACGAQEPNQPTQLLKLITQETKGE